MKCEYPQCNTEADILFYCRYCGGSFCQKHRDAPAHNCPSLRQGTQQSAQGAQGAQGAQRQVRPEEVMRRIAYGVAQAAQQAAQQQANAQEQVYFPDEKSKKEFIEKRLTASGDLFSLGNEVLDILFGFALIVLVFGFYQFIISTKNRWWGFAIAAILVGTAFLPHELAHKFVAMKKGQFARYILWVRGLMLTFLTLLIGIGLVVPGFVSIVPLKRQMNKKDMGMVAMAGPATNAVIGTISLIIGLLTYSGYATGLVGPLAMIGIWGKPNIFVLVAQFNGLIALFNCIPIWQFDGKKILKWSKVAFFILVGINLALVIVSFILNPKFLTSIYQS